MSGGNVELINTQPISINSYGSLIEVQAGMSAGGNLTMTGGTINITANPSTTDGSSYGSAVLIDDGATLGQLNVIGEFISTMITLLSLTIRLDQEEQLRELEHFKDL